MSGEKMEPCPFCEPLRQKLIGEPVLAGYGGVRSGDLWHGLCQTCGAEGPKEADPVAARAAWNRRPVPDDVRRAAEEALRSPMANAPFNRESILARHILGAKHD